MGTVKNDQIFVNTIMPVPLERQARIAAASQGISRSEFVRLALADYLARLNHSEAKGDA